MERKKIPTVSMLRFYIHAGSILQNPLPFHRMNFCRLGDIFQIRISIGTRLIFTRDAGFAEYVLQKNHKNYQKSSIQTRDMAKYLGKGLLTSTGEHWRKQRKLIQPAFHKKKLEGLLENVEMAIFAELDKIQPNQPIDIFPVFNNLAFQTVVKSLFSSAVGQKEITRLQYITEAAQKMLVRELRQPYLGWWFHLFGHIEKHIGLTREARDILRKLVRERKEKPSGEEDLLDMLLEARYEDGTAIEEEQLIDEILILFTAGHETTSNALTFTTQLLARYPDIQYRIVAEVLEAKKESKNPIDFITACPYTRQCIEEGMRLYPPAYFIDRVNMEDDEYNGYFLAKGSSVLLSVYEIHRNSNYWDRPFKFDPDRFEDSRKHAGYYFPFGAGPRKCIGNNFAMYEMILTIAELVSRYQIKYGGRKIKIKPLITLKPKDAILEFRAR